MAYPATYDSLYDEVLNQLDAVTGDVDPDYEGPGGEGFHAQLHNNVAASIMAMQGVMGLAPQGAYASIASRLLALEGSVMVTPEQYGAKADLKYVMDTAITASTKIVTSSTAHFTSADVGKTVHIRGAGLEANLKAFTTTIASVTNTTTAVLAANASFTVSNVCMIYGTDDTAAFRSALTHLFEEGLAKEIYEGQLLVRGKYMVAGAPIVGGSTKGNSQIPLPIIESKLPKFRFTLIAPGRGAPVQHWNQIHPQIAGPTIFSPLVHQEPDGTYFAASVMGGPTNMGTDPNGGDGFTQMMFAIEGGLTILTTRSPKHIGLDLRQVANVDLEHLSVLTSATPPEMWTDVTSEQFAGYSNGLRLPEFFNNDCARVTSLTVEGFSFGVVTGDHAHIQRLCTIYCNYDLYSNPAGLNHGLSVDSWSAEYSRHIILMENAPGAKYPVTLGRLDVEEVVSTMFEDPANVLRGSCHYASQGNIAPTKVGAEHLKIVDDNNTA